MNYSSYDSVSDNLKKAEKAREEEGYSEALGFSEKALDEYEKKEDYEGFVRALQSRILIYKHLFLISGDKTYLDNAKRDAEESLLLSKQKNLAATIGNSYFRLGEIAMLTEDYKTAIDNYELALRFYSGTKAEKGDYVYHLGEALYRKGKKGLGEEMLLDGLRQIEDNASDVNSFLFNVWRSGCYMRLADLLRGDKYEEAFGYLKKAQSIAKSDPRLIIRRRQIGELAKNFK